MSRRVLPTGCTGCVLDPRGLLFDRHAPDCPNRPLAGMEEVPNTPSPVAPVDLLTGAAAAVPEAGKVYWREGAVYGRDEHLDVAYGGRDALYVDKTEPDPFLGKDVVGFISYSGAEPGPYTTSFVIFEKGGWKHA